MIKGVCCFALWMLLVTPMAGAVENPHSDLLNKGASAEEVSRLQHYVTQRDFESYRNLKSEILVRWQRDLSPEARKARDQRVGRVLFPLARAVSEFKTACKSNADQALAERADLAIQQRWKTLGMATWSPQPTRAAWRFFFVGCVDFYGCLDAGKPLVGFYSPWCDLILLTSWKKSGPDYILADCELLMADFIRGGTVSPRALWLRGDEVGPGSIGQAVAETSRAFETRFPPDGRQDWRSLLPCLSEEKWMAEINAPGVSLAALTAVQRLRELLAAQPPGQPALFASRRLMQAKLEQAREEGGLSFLEGMDQTTPASATYIAQCDPMWFATLEPVGMLGSKGGILIFLASSLDEALSLSLFIETPTGGGPLIKRVDVLDYSAYVQAPPTATAAP